MDLILWRHAEAEDGVDDLARELTVRGRRQAASMAAWLAPRLPEDTRVIVSEAVRSRQTARALTDHLIVRPEVNPDAAPTAVLEAALWPEFAGVDAVVIVGHQPTLGQAAALLLTGEVRDWSMKKGAIWWLSGRKRDGERQVVLKAALTPDLLR